MTTKNRIEVSNFKSDIMTIPSDPQVEPMCRFGNQLKLENEVLTIKVASEAWKSRYYSMCEWTTAKIDMNGLMTYDNGRQLYFSNRERVLFFDEKCPTLPSKRDFLFRVIVAGIESAAYKLRKEGRQENASLLNQLSKILATDLLKAICAD